MKKGVAVPYIIAILLGVGVIGLVGYWLFVSGGQFSGSTATTACRSAQLQYCNQLINNPGIKWDSASAPKGCNAPTSNDCASYGVKVSPSGGTTSGSSGSGAEQGQSKAPTFNLPPINK